MIRVLVRGENTFPFHAVDEKRPQFGAALEGYGVTVTVNRALFQSPGVASGR
jgi:hypothetical protein